MPFYEYGGLYPVPRRNEPVKLKAVNPRPDNAMSNDTGNAGRDGYSVLSRADRYSGQRPLAGSMEAEIQLLGPNLAEET